jgi:hypothetical protein
MKLDRRALLRKAGLGSIALASLPTLANAVAKPVEAASQTNFSFVVVSKRVGQPEQIILDGSGGVDRSEVEAGGSFTWFNTTNGSIVAFGSWKATRLLNFSPGPTFGADQGGIIDLDVRLVRRPSSAVIRATLRMVCTIGGAGGGLPEGVVLTLVNGIRFEPIDVGITVFTIGNEREG